MARNSLGTIRTAKTPKHITEINMTAEQYYELKVYIKSIILPGTPPLECKRFDDRDNKSVYRQWTNGALEEIGPRFFPRDGRQGLVWPEDYDGIHNAVDQVVRALSVGIRKNYKKNRRLMTTEEHTNSDEMEAAQDDTNVGGMVVAVHREAPREEQEGRVGMMDLDDQNEDVLEEETGEPEIELEDLLGLKIGPEVYAHFPDLAEEHFDWDEIMDWSSPELIARPLLLLS